MAHAAHDIDRIVCEVVRQVRALPGQEPNRSNASQTEGQDSKQETGSLAIDAPVISLEVVENRLANVRYLTIGPRAVVTPAVRDLLRQSEITLRRAAEIATSNSAKPPLAVGMADTEFDPAAWLRATVEGGQPTEQIARTGIANVADELADLVTHGGRLGLLLTEATAAGVCLANRHRGVRAFAAADVAAVDHAVRSIGANLMVLDPTGRNLYEFQRMTTTFCRPGARTCPESLRERLG